MFNVYCIYEQYSHICSGFVKKFFWGVMLVGMFAGMVFNLYGLGNTFFSFTVRVSLSIVPPTTLDFPAVTICNLNPVKASEWNSLVVGMSPSGNSTSRRKRAGILMLYVII